MFERFLKPDSILLIVCTMLSCGNAKKQEHKQSELNIGPVTKKFELDLSKNKLQSFINLELLSDSSRNLIAQLGKYEFSTSIDAENQDENINNPDALIYYEYEGITLKYNFRGGGHYIDPKTGYVEQPDRSMLQSKMDEYPHGTSLEEIYIEPLKYKGALPYGLKKHSKAVDVINVFGKQDSLYNSTSEKLRYKYPKQGVAFLFAYDSTITYITLSDTLKK